MFQVNDRLGGAASNRHYSFGENQLKSTFHVVLGRVSLFSAVAVAMTTLTPNFLLGYASDRHYPTGRQSTDIDISGQFKGFGMVFCGIYTCPSTS